MAVSRTARAALGVTAAMGILAFLIVVELGVNAGRIHYGVSINEIDVGGLTEAEAAELLETRVGLVQFEPVVFTTEFLEFSFVPADVGWRPRVLETTRAAMSLGRDDVPFGAVADRVRAWFSGVKIHWTGSPRAFQVGEMIDEWEREAEGVGLTIDRGRLRARIRRAIVTWPRRAFKIPLATS
ncbi:MAG: hypothetical protein ACRDJI_04470 [Actinomycetota bacterium]